ncbi:hypothetical protein Tco_1170405, partial [Tanacetum coccineum]
GSRSVVAAVASLNLLLLSFAIPDSIVCYRAAGLFSSGIIVCFWSSFGSRAVADSIVYNFAGASDNFRS